jgi:hypothetical protein
MALKPSLRDVLSRLQSDGALPPLTSERALPALDAWWRKHGATPWYVRVLIGGGAWVAALFLGLFLALVLDVMGLDNSEGAFIVLGLMATGVGLALRRVSEHDFLGQLSLATGLAGQGLFVGGVGAASDSVVGAALAMLVLQVPLLVIHPDRIQRYLSTLGASGAVLVLLHKAAGWTGVELGLVALAAATHAVFLHQVWFQRQGLESLASPLGFGLVSVVFGMLTVRTLESVERTFREIPLGAPAFLLTLGFTAVALYSAYRMLEEHGLEAGGPVGLTVFAALGLTALLTLRTPGVIAAAGVLALAFHRRSVLLLGTAVAFLLTFGVFYYYDLALTLLAKSLALLGSGLVLLGLRLFVLRRFPAAPSPEVR